MLNQSINSSTLTAAVNSILEEMPVTEDPKEMEEEASVDKGDLEAVVLGVDPKEIMDNDSGREGHN